MPLISVGGINLYYEAQGDGEALVLINGYADHVGHWFAQAPGLAREYRLITFDNRGSGRSDKPDVAYTMQMFSRDVMGLLDALSIGAANIYSVSMGGMIAQEFALSNPEKVKNLILGCTTCGGIHQIMPGDEVLAFLLDEERTNRLTPEQAAREMFDYTCTREFIENNQDVVEKYVVATVEYAAPQYSLKRQAEAILTHDTYDRLPRIQAPTLVIAGGDDRLVPNENSRLLASRIPNAELAIVENAGHGFFYQAAELANSIIIDFINKHRRG